MCQTLRIAGIVNESIVDGPGIRFTLFVQGCPRRCEGCHNPDLLEFNGGYEVKINELYSQIAKNPLITGVTISGGEPFSQAKNLIPLAKIIKENNYELAIYTGFLFEELIDDKSSYEYKLLELSDILIDGPFEIENKDLLLRFKGSTNQRIIDVKKSIYQNNVCLDVTKRWNG